MDINQIVVDLTKYVAENKPKYLYTGEFVAGKNQILYSGPYWDEQEIMAAITTFDSF